MFEQMYCGYKIELDKQIEDDCVKNIWLVHTPEGEVYQTDISPYGVSPDKAISMIKMFIDSLIKGEK